METFQEFIKSFRPQHFAVGGPLNLLINTLAMWLVVNHMIDLKEKISLLRSGVCALLLYLVSSAAIAMLLFPTPIVFILAAAVWLVASLAIIKGVFGLTYQGGGGILFMYLLILVAVHGIAQKVLS
jgi:hypothetical protein